MSKIQKPRWVLVSVDAWADGDYGWNWNNWFKLSEPISEDRFPTDVHSFMNLLIEEGIIQHCIDESKFEFEQDNNCEHGNYTLYELQDETYIDEYEEEQRVAPRPIYAVIFDGYDIVEEA
jgi:hypothetical protein